jgi:hypothetical protein
MGCNPSSPATTVQSLDQAKKEEQRKPPMAIVEKNDPTITANTTVKNSSPKPASNRKKFVLQKSLVVFISAVPQMNDNKKHIMLSYQHASKELVLNVYEFLKNHQVRVWMDIKGGMEEHLLDR